jgi:hypothetical protein
MPKDNNNNQAPDVNDIQDQLNDDSGNAAGSFADHVDDTPVDNPEFSSNVDDGSDDGSSSVSGGEKNKVSFGDFLKAKGELPTENKNDKSNNNAPKPKAGEKVSATGEEDDDIPEDDTDTNKPPKKDAKQGGDLEIEEELDQTQDDINKQQNNQQQNQPKRRDYSWVPAEMLPEIKKLKNNEYAFAERVIKPLVTANNQLKQKAAENSNPLKLPDNYYNHPQAYTLSPEYQQIESNHQLASSVADHWAEQEVNIRRNGKFIDLVEKDGKIFKTEERDATAQDEVVINKRIRFANNQLARIEKQKEEVVGGFKKSHEDAVTYMNEAMTKLFPGFDAEDHPTKPMQKKIIEALPAPYQTHPLANVVATITAANALLKQEADTYKKELAKIKGIKHDATNAPPRKNNFVPGSNNNTAKVGTKMSDFEARKRAA